VQKEIAAKIIEHEGDYLLALKENHPTLCDAVVNEFSAAFDADVPPTELRRWKTVETNRGRQERREYFAMPAPPTLPGFSEWKKLKTIVLVIRTITVHRKETVEVHSFLCSLPPKVKTLAKFIRQHWSIENQLHWVLDVTFAEDASRIRKGTAPQTSAMFRRLAVSILSQDTLAKDNVRGKRYRASMSTDVLERLITGFTAQ